MCLTALCAETGMASAQTFVVSGGELRLIFTEESIPSLNPLGTRTGQLMALNEEDATALSFTLDHQSDFSVTLEDGVLSSFSGTILVDGGLHFISALARANVAQLALRPADEGNGGQWIAFDLADPESAALVVGATQVYVDRLASVLVISSDEVMLSRRLAARLGLGRLNGRGIASLVLRARLEPLEGERTTTTDAVSPEELGTAAGALTNPDVIVADLHASLYSYGIDNGISAFAIGTTSCNLGTDPALWISNTPEHPVIAQHLYRLKDNRFEQIGMSWLKHGFWALAGNICCLSGQSCCENPGTGTLLGVNCSDPYGAGLNGEQLYLRPRSVVNAYTGVNPGRTALPSASTLIERRLQVDNDDLNAALNPGALYFGEAHYVTADDAAAGNGENNASYRRYTIFFSAGSNRYVGAASSGASTVRQQPAIRAWQASDPSVEQVDIRVPGEGLFILAAKATDLGNGFWEYEYALHNLNSHRSAGSFRVPLRQGLEIQNTGFHDVDYHSGEPYDLTDWPVTVLTNAIVWATTPYAENENANALRWGTLYNFRFQATVAPQQTTVTIGLFRTGFPEEVTGRIMGPGLEIADCNENLIEDLCDVRCDAVGCVPPCGGYVDCNDNGVPDECEPDCNDNGQADACDLSGGGSDDCNANTVPDECEADCDGDGVPDDCDVEEDCDGDGIFDCDDLCPCSSPPEDACLCPAQCLCCFPGNSCFMYPCGQACVDINGVPECLESPCRAGCTLEETNGDADLDGDRDLSDLSLLLACFSNEKEKPAYSLPRIECLARFDFDFDDDIDLADFDEFLNLGFGPVGGGP